MTIPSSASDLPGLSQDGSLELHQEEGWDVQLDELSSAGYLWSATLDGSCAEVILSRPTSEERTKEEVKLNEHVVVGGPSLIKIQVWAKKPGEGVLHLVLQRPWLLFDESATRIEIPVRVHN